MAMLADVSTTSSLSWETVSNSSGEIETSPVHEDLSILTTNIHASPHEVGQGSSHADFPEVPQDGPVHDPGQHAAAGLATVDSDATSLHQAIDNRDLMSLNNLLNQGFDTETVNEHGEKPLYHACKVGFLQAVWPLLGAGADVESINPESQTHTTALHLTVAKNWLPETESLLVQGANVDAFSRNGMTALLIAIQNRYIGMIRLLLRYGANKRLRNVRGETPFDFAQGAQNVLALLEMSQGPPTTTVQSQEPQSHLKTSVRPPTDSHDKMIACHNFQAAVVEFHIGDFEERKTEVMSVYKLLYGYRPTTKLTERGAINEDHRVFRWYHLPANNASTNSLPISCIKANYQSRWNGWR